MTLKKKIDGRKNANVKRGHVIRMQDIHSDYLEFFESDLVAGEHCLNVCSGSSMVGDIRLDIDEKTNRTRFGDLFEVYKQFEPNSIPFVICDPPFNYYNPNSNIIKKKGNELIGVMPGLDKPEQLAYLWQFQLMNIASKCLILRRNLIMANIPARFKEYRLIRDSRPGATILEVLWK
jgi:hypothetical protein